MSNSSILPLFNLLVRNVRKDLFACTVSVLGLLGQGPITSIAIGTGMLILVLMTKSLQTKIQIKIFSDDLPEPSLSELLIDITAERKEYKVSDFTET
jgi:hypothetical protein